MADPKKLRLMKLLEDRGVDAQVEVSHRGYQIRVGHGDHLLVPSEFEGSSIQVKIDMSGAFRKKRK